MTIHIELTRQPWQTRFAPLAVLGHQYRAWQLLSPLQELDSIAKQVKYAPSGKFAQLLVSLLAGCESIAQVNTRLQPEEALAQSWGWRTWAEQSTLARLLDQLTQSNLALLRLQTERIGRRIAASQQHDWRGYLRLDLDLSGLPCSIGAQGSAFGYFGAKKSSQGAN